ncbi:2-oxo acid dehydrogenase subunit E2 [Streptomyces sp. NPDC087845]|uniref:2-oxo acid dehydrogenase subunit E2 n=1 Tax=Streptomyces sp. NPDC087845 TaxID=3365806 RepID=UPI0038304B37
MTPGPMARQRRHTLQFLGEIRSFAPVFLDTEIDMTRIGEHRTAARAAGHRYSVVTYVLHTAARVLADHPEANAAITGRIRPRVARYESVDGKLTLDRTLDGRRIVLSAVLPGLHRAALDDIQHQVDHYRDGDPATMPEFAGARALQRLPMPLGRLAYRAAVRPLGRRAARMGTFAVTSLGHRPVDGFHSVGGTTVTLGLGRIAERPVVRDHVVTTAPVMRLSLAFDHRVIDGAEAADVLGDLKDGLENPTGLPAADRDTSDASDAFVRRGDE